MKNLFAKFFATGFGTGYAPVAPGTFGTVPGIIFYVLALHFLGIWGAWPATLLVTIIAVWSSGVAEKLFGEKDCQKIVADEVAGVMVTCLALPDLSWKWILIAFGLFRIFDWIKIFPARWAQDNLPGGFGVVGDDIVAGFQGALVLWILS